MGRKKEAKKANKPRKKLALRKETLKDLGPSRAKDAKGGAIVPTRTCVGCLSLGC